jgi:hypothetical protein
MHPSGERRSQDENGIVGDNTRRNHQQKDHDPAIATGDPKPSSTRELRSGSTAPPRNHPENYGEQHERDGVADEGPCIADPVHQCDAYQWADGPPKIIRDGIHCEGMLVSSLLTSRRTRYFAATSPSSVSLCVNSRPPSAAAIRPLGYGKRHPYPPMRCKSDRPGYVAIWPHRRRGARER